jgi:sigma-B regulation protein RsbU (phosphoserine phosphatase)
MSTPVRLLHLEDNPHDAELVRELLRMEGLDCQMSVVDNEAEFTSALEHGLDAVL